MIEALAWTDTVAVHKNAVWTECFDQSFADTIHIIGYINTTITEKNPTMHRPQSDLSA